jgi:hypothetical protein
LPHRSCRPGEKLDRFFNFPGGQGQAGSLALHFTLPAAEALKKKVPEKLVAIICALCSAEGLSSSSFSPSLVKISSALSNSSSLLHRSGLSTL